MTPDVLDTLKQFAPHVKFCAAAAGEIERGRAMRLDIEAALRERDATIERLRAAGDRMAQWMRGAHPDGHEMTQVKRWRAAVGTEDRERQGRGWSEPQVALGTGEPTEETNDE